MNRCICSSGWGMNLSCRVHGRPGRVEGGPSVRYADRTEAGSCNFCSRPHEKIYEVRGKGVMVRFCAKCRSELRRFRG